MGRRRERRIAAARGGPENKIVVARDKRKITARGNDNIKLFDNHSHVERATHRGISPDMRCD